MMPSSRPIPVAGYRRSTWLATAGLSLLTLLLTGCATSVTILEPADATSVVNPVTVHLRLHSRANAATFRADVDGSDITGLFTFSGTPREATAQLPALSPGAHRIHAGADFSPGRAFDVHGDSSNVTVPAAPPPPPPPPPPAIRLQAPTAAIEIVWGASGSATASVEGRNGFAGNVDITIDSLPNGVTVSANPATVVVPLNGSATTTLSIATTAAATQLASPRFRVLATPQAGGAQQTAQVPLAIRRTPGNFGAVSLITGDSQCGTITARSVAIPGGPAVQFSEANAGVLNNPAYRFGPGYAIASSCRSALVVTPVAATGVFNNLVNLAFPGFLGGAAPGGIAPNPSGAFTNGYFSPDGSLFVLVTPGGPGTNQAAAAGLYDIARGTQVGSAKFFTATIVSVVLTGDQVVINTNPALSDPDWTVP